jgi:hypothetical protein
MVIVIIGTIAVDCRRIRRKNKQLMLLVSSLRNSTFICSVHILYHQLIQLLLDHPYAMDDAPCFG